jgi:hypothetical protein
VKSRSSAHRKRPRGIAADIAAARQSLFKQRDELAKTTFPDGPPVVATGRWALAEAVARQFGPLLSKRSGVVGYGPAERLKGGTPTGEVCLAVYVRRKRRRPALKKSRIPALPRTLKYGSARLRVDVVQLRNLQRHVMVGESIGPVSPIRKGTIGAAAIRTDGTRVAITAMHVMGYREFDDPAAKTVPVCVPSRFDNASSQIFGYLLRGSMNGIDAAAVRPLAAGQPLPVIPGLGPIRGWRPAVLPGDHGIPVRMAGAVSGVQFGVLVRAAVSLPAWRLSYAILASVASVPGDSGAPLVDANNLLLGFLTGPIDGPYPNLRVFTPAGPTLSFLGCDIPTI